ncbi:MAG: tyrosine-type recombinase/integrase [Candidatus Bathyarchaeota archaeon]|nr:tyrosine-type recombinase/integrase [Candidatus Bathyarchaeota archaeon]
MSDYSIYFTSKALRFLAKNCNLNDPESVKAFIGSLNVSNGYKRNLCIAYNKYVKCNGLSWNMPLYKVSNRLPKIPSTEKVNTLISNAKGSLHIRLMISVETGLRPIEVMNLRVRDVDLQNSVLYPSSAKYGSARAFKISQRLTDLLRIYIDKHNLKLNDRLFKGSANDYGKHFRAFRNRLAVRLNDLTLKSIRLYDLRHYYATMLYYKTRDILFVKQQLGHKKIETTLRYTQLVNFNSDEYVCVIARTVDEAQKLIENGFEYVTTFNDVMIFRKRK